MEKVVQNVQGSVLYDSGKRILIEEFSGRVQLDKAKEIFSKELEFAAKNEILGICSDITHLIGTFTHFNDYFEMEYFPYLIGKGLLCNCIVVSKDVFSQFATENLIKRMGTFEIRTFSNREEGLNWIDSMIEKNK